MTDRATKNKNIKICSNCKKETKYYEDNKNQLCKNCYERKRRERKSNQSHLIKCQCSPKCQEMIHSINKIGKLARFKVGHTNKGKYSSRWNGGRKKDSYGYILIWKPDHPYCNNDGYVQEHRLVYEEYLTKLNGIKTYIHPSIVVHHINEIKDDNRIENLVLMSKGDHMRLHRYVDYTNRICYLCHSDKTYIDKLNRPNWFRYEKNIICSKCRGKIFRDRKRNMGTFLT